MNVEGESCRDVRKVETLKPSLFVADVYWHQKPRPLSLPVPPGINSIGYPRVGGANVAPPLLPDSRERQDQRGAVSDCIK